MFGKEHLQISQVTRPDFCTLGTRLTPADFGGASNSGLCSGRLVLIFACFGSGLSSGVTGFARFAAMGCPASGTL